MAETSKIAVPSSRRPASRTAERDDGRSFPGVERRPDRRQSIRQLDAVKADPEVQAFIRNANRNLGVIGYTEHGFRHVGLVANIARNILKRMGFDRDSKNSRRFPAISMILATSSAASIMPAPARCSRMESCAGSAQRRMTQRS